MTDASRPIEPRSALKEYPHDYDTPPSIAAAQFENQETLEQELPRCDRARSRPRVVSLDTSQPAPASSWLRLWPRYPSVCRGEESARMGRSEYGVVGADPDEARVARCHACRESAGDLGG